MTADDVRALMVHLQSRVRLEGDVGRAVQFELPDRVALLEAGIHPDAVTQLLGAPWATEMVADVIETPEFCEPDDPPEMVLRYARDVVAEYIRKRFELTPES
jgi:hypothetical protein